MNYDVQLFTGWYNEHLTLGSGWAGFKGEKQSATKELMLALPLLMRMVSGKQ